MAVTVTTTSFELTPYAGTPDEIRLSIVKQVIIEACQNRDYQTLYAIFQVCKQWRGMADEILTKPFITAKLVPMNKPIEIYQALAQHPNHLVNTINAINPLFGDPKQWKSKEQHQQARIIAILMESLLCSNREIAIKPPLNCLVRILNESMHHEQLLSDDKESIDYQEFLAKTAHRWLYVMVPTNNPEAPFREELSIQFPIEVASFYCKKFKIIEKNPTHPLSLFYFQRFYKKFNIPAMQQNMLVASGSLRINWVEQPCLTLKLHHPFTRDREKLFNDPTNLDPNQTFVNRDPHRYTSEHIAFMLAQTVFSTRRGLGDLAAALKEKLNVNICRLENFIFACIKFDPTFDPKEPLFLELLSFAEKQNQFNRNQFVSNIVRILNRPDTFSAEVKRAIFKSIIPLIPDFNATFTQSQLLPEGEQRLEVSYLTYACRNEAIFGIEIIEELLTKKQNSSFRPIPVNELEGFLSSLIIKFLQETINSKDQKLIDLNGRVIYQLLQKAYEGSPEILENKKFLALAWFTLPETPLLEEKLKSITSKDVIFTQGYETTRQQGIECVDPALWRLFSLVDAPKIAHWCTYWSIDARAFVALYNCGKNALFPISNSVAFGVLKELLKQPQHSALNILREVFNTWNYTLEDFKLFHEDLSLVLKNRPSNQSLLTSFLENPVTALNPAILDQFFMWGATLPVNAIKFLSPISLQDEVIVVLKEKFGCAEPQNLKRASQENKTTVSRDSKKRLLEKNREKNRQ